MTKLTASRDSFISLLLEVSGRARPRDLQGVTLDESTELLHAYVAAHPELALSFEDDVLVLHDEPVPAPPVAAVVDAFTVPVPVEPVAPVAEAWTFGEDATFAPQVSETGAVIGYDFSAPPVAAPASLDSIVPPVTVADFAGTPAFQGAAAAAPSIAGEFVIPAPSESDFEAHDFVELPGMPQDSKRGLRMPPISMPVMVALGAVVFVIAVLGALYAMGMLDSVIGSVFPSESVEIGPGYGRTSTVTSSSAGSSGTIVPGVNATGTTP